MTHYLETYLGIDPSLSNLGWAVLYRNERNEFEYAGSGVCHHGIKGGGKWDKKIEQQIRNGLELLNRNPGRIIVEVPQFGSHGKTGTGTMVNIMAVMELSWRLIHEIHRQRPKVEVIPLKPDQKKKQVRAHFVCSTVRGWPAGRADHETDAAWLILRRQ